MSALERLLAEAVPDGTFGGARAATVTCISEKQAAANRRALEEAISRSPRRRARPTVIAIPITEQEAAA